MSIFTTQSYITEEMAQNRFTPNPVYRRYEKPVLDITEEQMSSKYVMAVMQTYEQSDNRQYMDVAEQYYHNNHDILQTKRFVIGRDSDNNPSKVESLALSNNHLIHNFLRKLAHQKLGYLLSRPFSFQPDTHDLERCEKFFKELGKYYDLTLYRTLKAAARDSIVDGIGWICVYYDEDKLKFKHIPSTELIPQWVDEDHLDLKSMIRKYTVKEFENDSFVTKTYVEYYTQKGVIKYVYAGDGAFNYTTGELIQVEPLTPYFKIKSGEKEMDATWTDIPFIPFKYDADEYSLLRRIKSLIDDYDKKTSDVANNIDDMPESITVIKNYDGASKEEFVHNKNQYRTIFVQGDGDARSLETPLNVGEVDLHLKRLREDIFAFGQGVNTTDKDIRDTSGVALRFLYGDLDMDCADWSDELQWSIYLLNWFISRDILFRTNQDYSDINYRVVFNTSMVVNQSEVINNIVQSKGILSDKTLLSNHPWVLDADEEIKQIESDVERELLQIQAEEEVSQNSTLVEQEQAQVKRNEE